MCWRLSRGGARFRLTPRCKSYSIPWPLTEEMRALSPVDSQRTTTTSEPPPLLPVSKRVGIAHDYPKYCPNP